MLVRIVKAQFKFQERDTGHVRRSKTAQVHPEETVGVSLLQQHMEESNPGLPVVSGTALGTLSDLSLLRLSYLLLGVILTVYTCCRKHITHNIHRAGTLLLTLEKGHLSF